MIIIILILLTIEFQVIDEYPQLGIVFSVLLILFIFNFFGLIFSGDGGAYIISFIIGFLMIDIVNLSERISPYLYGLLLLWYPAFECLFSIIRKRFDNKFTTNADNKHLHHLIFIYLKKKNKFKNEHINLITGVSINIFNLIIFLMLLIISLKQRI